MKKAMRLFVSFVLMVCLVQIVNAANVGVIARFKDSTEQSWCLSIADGSTAKEALDATDLNLEWSGIGSMAYLVDVNGVSPDYANNEGWSFWHQNSNGNAFEESSVGFGGYIVSPSGTSIGLAYSAYDPDDNYRYLTSPSSLPYDDCISKLNVKGIKAYVNGKKESGADENGGKIDTTPGSELELKITVGNLYDGPNDQDIEEITIEGILESIDDGSDLEDESNEFTLKPQKDKDISLKFNIPLEVDEGNYDLIISINGESENGFAYSKEITFDVEVDKEKHDIIFNKLDFSNDNIECGKSTSLDVNVINMGVNDETVKLTVNNDELGINIQESFELNEDPFDKGNSFSKSYSIKLPDKIPDKINPGEYTIFADLFYEGKIESSVVKLNVKCSAQNEQSSNEENIKEITSAVNNPATPKTGNLQGTIKTAPAKLSGAAITTTEEKKLFNSNLLMPGIFIGEVILLIAGIVLLMHLLRK